MIDNGKRHTTKSPPRKRVDKALGQKQFPPYYHSICLFLNVFTGDFTQLTPVQGKPIYLEKDFIRIWDELVHTFLELKTIITSRRIQFGERHLEDSGRTDPRNRIFKELTHVK